MRSKALLSDDGLLDVVAHLGLDLCVLLAPSAPPYAGDGEGEDADDDLGAEICAGVYVPGPFLRGPEGVLQDGVHAALPEEEGRRPGEVGVELVVERASEQNANDICSQNRREHILWCYAPRDQVLYVA